MICEIDEPSRVFIMTKVNGNAVQIFESTHQNICIFALKKTVSLN